MLIHIAVVDYCCNQPSIIIVHNLFFYPPHPHGHVFVFLKCFAITKMLLVNKHSAIFWFACARDILSFFFNGCMSDNRISDTSDIEFCKVNK